MNKIKILDSKLEIVDSDDKLNIDFVKPYSEFDVLQVKIVVRKSTELELCYEEVDSKIDVSFVVEQEAVFHLFEVRKCQHLKAQYTYNLEENSCIEVTKFYDVELLKELDLIQLNGAYASITYHLNTIARGSNRFDIVTYHNAPHTTSNLINHGVTVEEGSISFQVTSVVDQGIKECNLSQNNRIITLNHKKCNINPILLIEENEVIANHSASIGKFNPEIVFYLMSRGIPEKQVLHLLIKGFLLESVPETDLIHKILEQYWG